jgi:hypothetical protein
MGAPVHMPMHPKHMDLTWEVGRIALASDAPSGTLNVHQALASPRVSNHVGVTTIERLDQGHLYPNLEVPGLTCPGRESNPGLPRGKRAL